MSDWFRGVIDAAYVGTPAKPRANTPLQVAPYDIKLYRGTINALERIPAPDDEPIAPQVAQVQPSALQSSESKPSTAQPPAPQSPAPQPPAPQPPAPQPVPSERPASAAEPKRELRQAQLLDVQFLGVGAEDASDEHAAYDLRITDVRLLGSTEADDQIYGRLSGTVVGCLTPSARMRSAAAQSEARSRKRNQQLGSWVEGVRWVMIATVGWMSFGTCGNALGVLWLAIVLPTAFLRLIMTDVVTPTHGTRVFGWAMVLACASLGGLMFYRVTHLECDSTLWWIVGMIVAVVITSLLPSRYPFFWTKAILAGTVLPLCSMQHTTCKTERALPSVVSQGPRTDPDGHWPRQPSDGQPGSTSASTPTPTAAPEP